MNIHCSNLFLDFNECTAYAFTCDVNAACQNTVGSFACSCTTGYTGDGQTCNGKNLMLIALKLERTTVLVELRRVG